MKIGNSYKKTRSDLFLAPKSELEQDTLIVTELHASNVDYARQSEGRMPNIECLRFQCSLEEFNQLPSETLRSCNLLLTEYPNIKHIQFPPSFTCDSSYVRLLIRSRAPIPGENGAKICLNLINSIYAIQNKSPYIARSYMPLEVRDDLVACIYSYIKSNSYSEFVNKLRRHFESEQSYDWAIKGTAISTLVAVTSGMAFFASLNNPGYHSSVLAAVALATIPGWFLFISPEFSIQNGTVNFESASRRVDLIALYKDIGGKKDYQLWDDSEIEQNNRLSTF